ncbi:MAG: hypothetical protein WA842_05285, partial [Croceibacterium sp.]
MILANSFLSLLSPAAPKGPKGDVPAAGADFSALFAALALGSSGPEKAGEDTAPSETETKVDPALLGLTLAATGKPAALPGKSGKILPLPLPSGNALPAGDDEPGELAKPEPDEPVATGEVLTAPILPGLVPVPALPVPTVSVVANGTGTTASPTLPTATASMMQRELPVQTSTASVPASPASPATPASPALPVVPASPAVPTSLGTPALPALSVSQDSAPKVMLQMAPQPVAPLAKEGAAPQPQIAPLPANVQQSLAAPLVAELAPAETRPRPSAKIPVATAHLAQPAPLMAAPIMSDAATPFPLMPVQAAAQALSAAGQDLATIVDRLSAAREALAPANATLSIDHAEFGELSLRFNQKADGALTVQLAAATPEAHRAISAAVGAEGGQFLSAEGQPQPQAQPQQQQQPGNSSAHSTASQAAERDTR